VVIRKGLLSAVVSLAVVAAALVVLESPAAAITRGPYYYEGFSSEKCIDNPGGQLGNNVIMTIYTCTPGAYNEQWYEIDTDSGYVQIRNRKSGKCLTVRNASMDDNELVIQFRCEGAGTNADWFPQYVTEDQDTGEDFYRLINRHSRRCLTVQNASSNNGARLLQYDCFPPQGNNLWTWRHGPYGPS
jgi:hypothetical protein